MEALPIPGGNAEAGSRVINDAGQVAGGNTLWTPTVDGWEIFDLGQFGWGVTDLDDYSAQLGITRLVWNEAVHGRKGKPGQRNVNAGRLTEISPLP